MAHGGTRDQDHTVGLADGGEEGILLLLVETELLHPDQGGARLQDTQHHLLPVQGW